MSSAVNLIASNNYYPGLSNLTFGNASTDLVIVPPGSIPGSLTSPKQTFLESALIADSTNILDVSKAPYNVVLGGTNDCTAAIQQAINDAKAANNGSIVYLPLNAGTGFYISSPLTLSGSNYKLQGSGLWTKVVWKGLVTGGTMISVTSPQNISLEQLALQGTNNTTNMVVETSTGPSTMTYDGVYTSYTGTYNLDGPGVVLSNLPAGSVVYAPHLDAPLTVNDCGAAQIFMKYLCMGQVTIKGATHAKTGFLGVAIAEGMQETPTGYNITVNDNQDLVFGDYYNEQNYNDLNLQRGSATWTGRVTIQGFKEQCNANSTQININNYAGRLMYGPQSFSNNTVSTVITQSGLNAINLILPGDVFWNGAPTFTLGAGCTLIEAGNLSILSGTTTYRPNFPNPLTAANLASMAAGFDHLRQLGATNLSLDYGLVQTVNNPTFETDSANPSPTTTLGYTAAGWVITNGTSINGGVRNATVVSGGSPFGPGAQSVLMIDTTGTSSGSGVEFYQNTPTTMPASQGAVWTFDFRLNGGTGTQNDNWIGIFAGSTRCSYIHISGNSTSGGIGANVNGKDSGFGAPTLVLGTWYRLRVILGAPSAGKSNATVWLTPWNGTVPGTPLGPYTIDGVPSVLTSGFSKAYFKYVAPGEHINMNVDNVMIQNGTFAFPSLP